MFPVNLKLTDIKTVMRSMCFYSVAFFSVGVIFDLVLYIIEAKLMLAAINILTLIVFAISMILYFSHRIDEYTTIFIQLIIIVFNILLSMLHEAWLPDGDSKLNIIVNMCIYLVPVILSAISKYKYTPYFISVLGLSVYTFTCVMTDSKDMLAYLPTLMLVFIGIPVVLVNVIGVTTRIESENAKFMRQQEVLLETLDFDPKLLHLLDSDNMNQKHVTEFLDKLDGRLRDAIIARVREVMNTEEKAIKAISGVYPNLTTGEMDICLMILDGKTVSEICEIRHVSPSTVTSMRSRLRTKLGLSKGESLEGHLRSLVNAGGNG